MNTSLSFHPQAGGTPSPPRQVSQKQLQQQYPGLPPGVKIMKAPPGAMPMKKAIMPTHPDTQTHPPPPQQAGMLKAPPGLIPPGAVGPRKMMLQSPSISSTLTSQGRPSGGPLQPPPSTGGVPNPAGPTAPQFAIINGKKLLVPPASSKMYRPPPQHIQQQMGSQSAMTSMSNVAGSRSVTPLPLGNIPPAPVQVKSSPGQQPNPPRGSGVPLTPLPLQQQQQQLHGKPKRSGLASALHFFRLDSNSSDDRRNTPSPPPNQNYSNTGTNGGHAPRVAAPGWNAGSSGPPRAPQAGQWPTKSPVTVPAAHTNNKEMMMAPRLSPSPPLQQSPPRPAMMPAEFRPIKEPHGAPLPAASGLSRPSSRQSQRSEVSLSMVHQPPPAGLPIMKTAIAPLSSAATTPVSQPLIPNSVASGHAMTVDGSTTPAAVQSSSAIRVPPSTVLKDDPLPAAGTRSPAPAKRLSEIVSGATRHALRIDDSDDDSDDNDAGALAASQPPAANVAPVPHASAEGSTTVQSKPESGVSLTPPCNPNLSDLTSSSVLWKMEQEPTQSYTPRADVTETPLSQPLPASQNSSQTNKSPSSSPPATALPPQSDKASHAKAASAPKGGSQARLRGASRPGTTATTVTAPPLPPPRSSLKKASPSAQKIRAAKPTRSATPPAAAAPLATEEDDTEKPPSVRSGRSNSTAPSVVSSASPKPHRSRRRSGEQLPRRDKRYQAPRSKSQPLRPETRRRRSSNQHGQNSSANTSQSREEDDNFGSSISSHHGRLCTDDLYRLARVLREQDRLEGSDSGAKARHRGKNDDLDAWNKRGGRSNSVPHARSWGASAGIRHRTQLPSSTVGIPWRYVGKRSSDLFQTPSPIRRPLGYINIGGGQYAQVGCSPYTRPSRASPTADPYTRDPVPITDGKVWVQRAGVERHRDVYPPALTMPDGHLDPQTSAIIAARDVDIVGQLQSDGLRRSPCTDRRRPVSPGPLSVSLNYHRIEDTSSTVGSSHPYWVPPSALLPMMQALSSPRRPTRLRQRGGDEDLVSPVKPASAAPSPTHASPLMLRRSSFFEGLHSGHLQSQPQPPPLLGQPRSVSQSRASITPPAPQQVSAAAASIGPRAPSPLSSAARQTPPPPSVPSPSKKVRGPSKSTISRLSSPSRPSYEQQYLHRHQGSGSGSRPNGMTQACSRWLDDVLSSHPTIGHGATPDRGGTVTAAAAPSNAQSITIVDRRREFKPATGEETHSRSSPPVLSSRATPHVASPSFKHMTGARRALGDGVAMDVTSNSARSAGGSRKPSPSTRGGTAGKVGVRTIPNIPDGLPFAAYSTIKVRDPQRRSPWALAPEREGLDVLPGRPAVVRRCRRRGTDSADSTTMTATGTRGGTGGVVLEEVHLDEQRRPYLVLRELPLGEAAAAQQEAMKRLAKPRPVYQRAEGIVQS